MEKEYQSCIEQIEMKPFRLIENLRLIEPDVRKSIEERKENLKRSIRNASKIKQR